MVLFSPLSITGALQDKDLRVVNEPVGNGRGNRSGVKDLPPVGKRQVGGDNTRFILMPLADDLEE